MRLIVKRLFNLVTILLFAIVILLTSCGREEVVYLSDEESRILEESIPPRNVSLEWRPILTEISHNKYMDSAMPDGEIDFSVVQSINENMPSFIFNILGGYRMFQGLFCSEPILQNSVVDTIRIADMQGRLIQEISGFLAVPTLANEANYYGLHFADYNFDGYLDIAMHMRRGGNRDAGDFYYWLWNSEIGQFVFHEQLSSMRGNGNISINEEKRQIVVWHSHVGGRHHTFYEYNNGIFKPVEIVYWELYFSWLMPEGWNPPEEYYNVRLTHIDLLTGIKEVSYEYWP